MHQYLTVRLLFVLSIISTPAVYADNLFWPAVEMAKKATLGLTQLDSTVWGMNVNIGEGWISEKHASVLSRMSRLGQSLETVEIESGTSNFGFANDPRLSLRAVAGILYGRSSQSDGHYAANLTPSSHQDIDEVQRMNTAQSYFGLGGNYEMLPMGNLELRWNRYQGAFLGTDAMHNDEDVFFVNFQMSF